MFVLYLNVKAKKYQMKSVLKQREGSRVTTRSRCEDVTTAAGFCKGQNHKRSERQTCTRQAHWGREPGQSKRSSCWKVTRCWPSDAGGRLARLLLCFRCASPLLRLVGCPVNCSELMVWCTRRLALWLPGPFSWVLPLLWGYPSSSSPPGFTFTGLQEC